MSKISFPSFSRVSLIGLAATLTTLIGTGCSSKTEKPILVGHIAPFSGSDKTLGEHGKQGIVLAVEECNQDDHKIAGQKVAVLHVDSQGKSEIAQAEADRLVSVNKVDGLVTLTTDQESERLARNVESTGIALVVCNPVISTSSETPLSVSLSPSQQGSMLARFAQGDDLKAKKAVLVIDTHLGISAEVANAFARSWSKEQAHAVEQWAYDSKDRFKDLAERVQKSSPDCVLLAGAAADLSPWRSALQAVNVKIPLIFAGPETMTGALQANREAGRGIYFATSYVPGEEDTDVGKAFAKKFQERFHEPPDLNAALAYDAAGLVFEAIRRSKANDGMTAREALAKIDTYTGLTGPFVIKDRVLRRTVFIAHLDDGGRAKVLKKFSPED
jgi:branched-chain amino acid transport system substrate-binding protein